MASETRHRPLPALISLLALLLLTALVWWRVINRDSGSDHQARSCASPTASATPTAGTPGSGTQTLPAPSSIDVTVLNATSRNGLATKTRTSLRQAGFASSQPAGNYSGPKITGVGEVQFVPAARAAAQLVQYWVPGVRLVPTSGAHGSARAVTVVLGPQYRALATPAQVRSAMARSSTVPSPSASSSTAARAC